jgi:hypothetical protein
MYSVDGGIDDSTGFIVVGISRIVSAGLDPTMDSATTNYATALASLDA